jgi:hypothetical protein
MGTHGLSAPSAPREAEGREKSGITPEKPVKRAKKSPKTGGFGDEEKTLRPTWRGGICQPIGVAVDLVLRKSGGSEVRGFTPLPGPKKEILENGAEVSGSSFSLILSQDGKGQKR